MLGHLLTIVRILELSKFHIFADANFKQLLYIVYVAEL